MTTAFEHTERAEAAPRPAWAVTRTASIKAWLARLWPATAVGVGLVLTVIWNGGLVWLLMRLI